MLGKLGVSGLGAGAGNAGAGAGATGLGAGVGIVGLTSVRKRFQAFQEHQFFPLAASRWLLAIA